MGLENGIGKSQMSAFVKSRVANIKSQDMMSMASTMSTVIKESEKEENKDTSLADILAALVEKNKLKQASKDTQEKDDDGR